MPIPIPYDPSKLALYRPESRPPLRMTHAWSPDAVAAEFSRLVYRRFETDPREKPVIADAIAAIGYEAAGWFHETAEKALVSAKGFGAIDHERRAIIAFRGTQTDNVRDFLTDIRVTLDDWNIPAACTAASRRRSRQSWRRSSTGFTRRRRRISC